MCKELDDYLNELEKIEGHGAITAFAGKLGVNRTNLWRFRKGKRKPSKEKRAVILRLTFNIVKPEHFK